MSPCSSTFMSSNNLDYLMLRSGNNQIIMNIPCMYRTCALTSDTTPVCYKHCICKQNRIYKFSRLIIRACWGSRDKISMLRLLVLGTMLDKPFVPRRYFLLQPKTSAVSLSWSVCSIRWFAVSTLQLKENQGGPRIRKLMQNCFPRMDLSFLFWSILQTGSSFNVT